MSTGIRAKRALMAAALALLAIAVIAVGTRSSVAQPSAESPAKTMKQFLSLNVEGDFIQLRPHPGWMRQQLFGEDLLTWAKIKHVGDDFVLIEEWALRSDLLPNPAKPAHLNMHKWLAWLDATPQSTWLQPRSDLLVSLDSIQAVGPVLESQQPLLLHRIAPRNIDYSLWISF